MGEKRTAKEAQDVRSDADDNAMKKAKIAVPEKYSLVVGSEIRVDETIFLLRRLIELNPYEFTFKENKEWSTGVFEQVTKQFNEQFKLGEHSDRGDGRCALALTPQTVRNFLRRSFRMQKKGFRYFRQDDKVINELLDNLAGMKEQCVQRQRRAVDVLAGSGTGINDGLALPTEEAQAPTERHYDHHVDTNTTNRT